MKRKYQIIFILLTLVSLVAIFPMDNANSKLDIVGSTSVQPICEQLVEEYRKTNKNIDINVQGGGTSLGIKCASNSLADIGMSSKEINCKNLTEYEIGKEGIVVVVNRDNLINDLSTNQLQKIYSGEITNWDELSNYSGRINVIVREEGSGTLDAFKEIIMNKTDIKRDAIVQNSPGSVSKSVIQDKNAIGFVSFSYLDKDLKDVKINGVKASETSIKEGSYRLQRPFIFLTDETSNSEIKDFIGWVRSNESNEIFKQEKIIKTIS